MLVSQIHAPSRFTIIAWAVVLLVAMMRDADKHTKGRAPTHIPGEPL